MKKPIFIVILLCFSMLLLCGVSFSSDSTTNRSTRREASIGIGAVIDDGQIAGMISLGIILKKVFEFDLNAGVEPSVDAIFSGNFSLNLPSKSVTPFATIGGGMCVHGSFFWNFGGGLKIRMTDKLSIRAEYRYYNVSVILGGLSYFF